MERIGVVGAGTMGHGIAQVAATAGCQVRWFDSNGDTLRAGRDRISANLEKAVKLGKLDAAQPVLDRIELVAAITDVAADAELVVEAIPENIEWKIALFSEVVRHSPERCILATNTSSLSVTRIAHALADPSRVIGTHFFNPVHLMTLIEIVVGELTNDDVLQRTQEWCTQLGKDVIVIQDTPGFATSRLGVCLGMEAVRMVEQGVASPEDIDKAMVLGYRHPIGPLRLTDMVGLDVRLAIGEYLAKELCNPAFEPPKLMRRMVAEGLLGKKTGRGFYDWP